MDRGIYCPDSSGSDGGTDLGTAVKSSHPIFHPGSNSFCPFLQPLESFNTVALFTKPSEAMQIQAAAAPAQPLEVINDLRRFCFGDIRKTLD